MSENVRLSGYITKYCIVILYTSIATKVINFIDSMQQDEYIFTENIVFGRRKNNLIYYLIITKN